MRRAAALAVLALAMGGAAAVGSRNGLGRGLARADAAAADPDVSDKLEHVADLHERGGPGTAPTPDGVDLTRHMVVYVTSMVNGEQPWHDECADESDPVCSEDGMVRVTAEHMHKAVQEAMSELDEIEKGGTADPAQIAEVRESIHKEIAAKRHGDHYLLPAHHFDASTGLPGPIEGGGSGSSVKTLSSVNFVVPTGASADLYEPEDSQRPAAPGPGSEMVGLDDVAGSAAQSMAPGVDELEREEAAVENDVAAAEKEEDVATGGDAKELAEEGERAAAAAAEQDEDAALGPAMEEEAKLHAKANPDAAAQLAAEEEKVASEDAKAEEERRKKRMTLLDAVDAIVDEEGPVGSAAAAPQLGAGATRRAATATAEAVVEDSATGAVAREAEGAAAETGAEGAAEQSGSADTSGATVASQEAGSGDPLAGPFPKPGQSAVDRLHKALEWEERRREEVGEIRRKIEAACGSAVARGSLMGASIGAMEEALSRSAAAAGGVSSLQEKRAKLANVVAGFTKLRKNLNTHAERVNRVWSDIHRANSADMDRAVELLKLLGQALMDSQLAQVVRGGEGFAEAASLLEIDEELAEIPEGDRRLKRAYQVAMEWYDLPVKSWNGSQSVFEQERESLTAVVAGVDAVVASKAGLLKDVDDALRTSASAMESQLEHFETLLAESVETVHRSCRAALSNLRRNVLQSFSNSKRVTAMLSESGVEGATGIENE